MNTGCYQNGSLFLNPSHALPSPNLTLDPVIMQSLGAWNQFTNLKMKNKKQEGYLSDQHTDSLPCSHITTRADRRAGVRTHSWKQQWSRISPFSDSSNQIKQNIKLHTETVVNVHLKPTQASTRAKTSPGLACLPCLSHLLLTLPPPPLYSSAAVCIDSYRGELTKNQKYYIKRFSPLLRSVPIPDSLNTHRDACTSKTEDSKASQGGQSCSF